MRTRSLITLLILLAAALIAAGCGGGEEVAPPVAPATGAADPNAPVVSNTSDPSATGGTSTTATDTEAPEIPNVKGDDLTGGLGALDGESNLFTPVVTLADDFDAELDPDFDKDEEGADETDTSNDIDPKDTMPAAAYEFGPAKVLLDDQTYTVDKNSVFPSDTQLFQVLSLSADSIQVELVAGEFSNGSTGVTLTKGKKVSLVNQNEGITYTLQLVSVAKKTQGAGTGGQGCGFYC